MEWDCKFSCFYAFFYSLRLMFRQITVIFRKTTAGTTAIDVVPAGYYIARLLFSSGSELHGKVAHERCFPCDFHTACYLIASVEHILESHGYHVHVVVGIGSAGDGQTQQIVASH